MWLCGTTNQPANLNLSKSEIAYAARQSAKNILYTYIDTYSTASDIKVNADAKSPLYTALLAVLNILLAAGIILCVTFA